MNKLSADPYEGARRAYQLLKPTATDEDWELWVAMHTPVGTGGLDKFEALAKLCRDAIASGQETEPAVAHHICFAGGWFEAMQSVVASLLSALPISSCVPHHLDRYRATLLNPDAQFE